MHHLEEVETLLEERAPMWTEIWEERGREQGLKLRQRIQSAEADRLLEWGDQILTAERIENVFRNS